MEFGDFMGLAAVVCGGIAVCGITASVIKRMIALQERKIEIMAGQTAEKAAQYASHNRELEDRLRVVERIVTDKGYDVALQIEALRDARAVEERRPARVAGS
jgi:hypothetical protein